jgi:hypothetical protein
MVKTSGVLGANPLAAILVLGCTSGPSAPPLDIRGLYNVTWGIGYHSPDAEGFVPNLPQGSCSGSIDITKQGDHSFEGTIIVLKEVQPVCQATTFKFRGRLSRVYFGGSDGVDFGWDLDVTSEIEPLLGCSYVSAAPGNSPTSVRASGRIDPAKNIHLAFGGIYTCPSGRWWIIGGADGQGVR